MRSRLGTGSVLGSDTALAVNARTLIYGSQVKCNLVDFCSQYLEKTKESNETCKGVAGDDIEWLVPCEACEVASELADTLEVDIDGILCTNFWTDMVINSTIIQLSINMQNLSLIETYTDAASGRRISQTEKMNLQNVLIQKDYYYREVVGLFPDYNPSDNPEESQEYSNVSLYLFSTIQYYGTVGPIMIFNDRFVMARSSVMDTEYSSLTFQEYIDVLSQDPTSVVSSWIMEYFVQKLYDKFDNNIRCYPHAFCERDSNGECVIVEDTDALPTEENNLECKRGDEFLDDPSMTQKIIRNLEKEFINEILGELRNINSINDYVYPLIVSDNNSRSFIIIKPKGIQNDNSDDDNTNNDNNQTRALQKENNCTSQQPERKSIIMDVKNMLDSSVLKNIFLSNEKETNCQSISYFSDENVGAVQLSDINLRPTTSCNKATTLAPTSECWYSIYTPQEGNNMLNKFGISDDSHSTVYLEAQKQIVLVEADATPSLLTGEVLNVYPIRTDKTSLIASVSLNPSGSYVESSLTQYCTVLNVGLPTQDCLDLPKTEFTSISFLGLLVFIVFILLCCCGRKNNHKWKSRYLSVVGSVGDTADAWKEIGMINQKVLRRAPTLMEKQFFSTKEVYNKFKPGSFKYVYPDINKIPKEVIPARKIKYIDRHGRRAELIEFYGKMWNLKHRGPQEGQEE